MKIELIVQLKEATRANGLLNFGYTYSQLQHQPIQMEEIKENILMRSF